MKNMKDNNFNYNFEKKKKKENTSVNIRKKFEKASKAKVK